MATEPKHYATSDPFVVNKKSYLSAADAARVASYEVYEDLYWNNPETIQIKVRGDNDMPIHVPSARIIANTINRYVAPEFRAVPDPLLGTPAERTEIEAEFTKLFRRERFYSRFLANKLSGIRCGDSCWYITADPEKPEGSRISIQTLHPGTYFEIEDPDKPGRVIGCQIIEEGTDGAKDDPKPTLEIQTWLKPGASYNGFTNEGDEFITYQYDVFMQEGYGTPEQKSGPGTEPPVVIEGITQLPIYRIANSEEIGTDTWGSSEYRGLETLLVGINQSASDEDLALALLGLGLYWTDGGAPVDENGNETDWDLNPGSVAEVGKGNKFGKIDGITSITPFQEHMKFLADKAGEVNGAGDVAQGKVDVSVAESGVALAMRLAPILDSASQKETWLIDRMNQMLHDLKEWFSAYEGIDFGEEAEMISSVGDKLPQNKQQEFDNLLTLYQASPPLISGATFRLKLRDLGIDIPEGELQTILDEQIQFNQAADVYNDSLDQGGNNQDQGELTGGQEDIVDAEVVE